METIKFLVNLTKNRLIHILIWKFQYLFAIFLNAFSLFASHIFLSAVYAYDHLKLVLKEIIFFLAL